MNRPSFFHPSAPADVRRLVGGLLVVAVLGLAYSALYGNYYSFRTPLGLGLPDVSTSASVLVDGLRALALLATTWAIGLALVASPSGAAGLRSRWTAAVEAEARRPRAWLAATVLAVAYAVARVLLNPEVEPATLAMLTEGTARTPYQYRALVPFLVQMVVHGVPSLNASLGLPYGIVEGLGAGGVWLAGRFFLRPLLRSHAEASLAALGLLAMVALNLATPWRHNAYLFPWDTLSVVFFTAGLGLILRRRWGLYYLLFVVATVNRETTCFLTMAMVLSQWGRMPLRRLAAHGAAQLALWVGLKALLAFAYAGNLPLSADGPNSALFVFPVTRNLGALSGVPGLLLLSGAMGGLWMVAVALRARVVDPEVRRLCRVIPVFLVGMLLVGEVLEVRIYTELIPLVAASLAVALRHLVHEMAPPASPHRTAHGGAARTGMAARRVASRQATPRAERIAVPA